MGHLIFREVVGFNNYSVPSWLDEGVASFQEKMRRSVADLIVKQAKRKSKFINLVDLGKLNPHLMQDKEAVDLFYYAKFSQD